MRHTVSPGSSRAGSFSIPRAIMQEGDPSETKMLSALQSAERAARSDVGCNPSSDT